MKTSINYICGSVYVEATIQRIALFPVLPNGKKQKQKQNVPSSPRTEKYFRFLPICNQSF